MRRGKGKREGRKLSGRKRAEVWKVRCVTMIGKQGKTEEKKDGNKR